MIKFLLSGALALCVTSAATQRAVAVELIWIAEAWSCADWASRAKGAASIEHHLVGLINGMALASGLDLWKLPTEIEKDQLFYWMDQYCASNPLNFVWQGSEGFASERRGTAWTDKFKQ